MVHQINKKVALPIILAMALLMILAAPVSAQAEVPPAPELPTDLGTEEVLPPLPEPEFIPPPPAPEVIPPPDLSGLAQALADEQLLLADEKGELLSMAEQEVVHSTDPWFRVGTLIYRYATDCTGLDNCTQSDAPIQTALNAIQGGLLPTDRTLYIDTGSFDEPPVVLNGLLSPNLAMMTRILGEGMDNTFLNTDLTINNTINGFTVSGLTINGKLYMHHNRGTLNLTNVAVSNDEGDGVVIEQHTGAIVATNLKANGSLGNGAMLENLLIIAPVTLTGSTFDYNNDGDDENGAWVTGLTVQSRGMVTLNGVSASYNNGTGAFFDIRGGLTVRNSLFVENRDNTNDDTGEMGVGLHVPYTAAGNILIENTLVNNNGTTGMRLFTTGNITLTQVSASGNEGSGLMVRSDIPDGDFFRPGAGLLTINNGGFNNNGGNGIAAVTRLAATLTRIYANNNGGDGVFVRTPANILVNSIEARENYGGYGAYLNNQVPSAIGTVTLLDTLFDNQFNGNHEDGLYIVSNNTINLRKVNAWDNTGNGVTLNNRVLDRAPAVTLQRLSTGNNGLYGLLVTSRGAVSWTDGGSYSNGWNAGEETVLNPDNVLIDNAGAYSFQSVTINRVNSNNSKFGNGIAIVSRGAVLLTDVNSDWNESGHGVSINNLLGSGAVRITSTIESLNNNSFNNNAGYGLSIYANGAVTLVGVSARDNTGYGAYIDSSSASGLYPVALTNVDFSNNQYTGLYVLSRGAITVTNINAANNNDNDGEPENEGIGGAYLDNTAGSGAVSILRTQSKWHNWFGDNEGTGLEIHAKGPITLVRVGANNNQGYGADLDNCLWDWASGQCLGTGTVSISNPIGYNSFFQWNGSTGLNISSKGAITASNISADNNGWMGASLDNNWSGASGGVTLLAYGDHTNSFNENWHTGLGVYSVGAINLTRIAAERNNYRGVYLYNEGALANQPVTVTDGSIYGNHNDGLTIRSKGAVRLIDVQSNDNDVISGTAYVGDYFAERITDEHQSGDNWTFDWTAGTDPLVIRVETDEGFDPILELADGTGNPVTADAFEGDGQYYQLTFNSLASGNYTVTVHSSAYDKSGNYALAINPDVLPSGKPQLVSVGAEGIRVTTSTTAGSLSITSTQYGNSQFSNNSSTGLVALLGGAVTFRNVRVADNGGFGAYIDNCLTVSGKCTGVGGFSTSGYTEFVYNRYDGLKVYTTGAINMVDVDAAGNGGFGAYLSNDKGYATVSITSVMQRPNWYSGFSNNGDFGLQIISSGAISLNRVMANNNGTFGLYANNTTAIYPKPITISNSQFNENRDGTGAYADSHGLITFNTVTANDNTVLGAHIKNDYVGFNNSVTILNSTFNSNSYGLTVATRGNILANGLSASGNDFAGVQMSNDSTGAVGTITLLNTLGLNGYYNNGTNGLTLFSNRAISVTGISLGWNGYGSEESGDESLGFLLVSRQAGITLRNAWLENNAQTGVVADAYGAVLFDRVYSYNNGWADPDGTRDDGAQISSGFGNVTLLNSAFAGNNGSGYGVNINLPVFRLFLTNTTAYANDRDGSGDPETIVY